MKEEKFWLLGKCYFTVGEHAKRYFISALNKGDESDV
ncbi:hypothetical protein A5821_002634 [Enterococcus sp. 7F3_DIV0205]|uniref:Uncharacterized protein n=1 Tax=Candidatus Enterococcus palustris TaxID=1834189 RepID=A0AAQ3Y6W4_9ENTE|nr:hypothetical protein A5821_002988 [Enterococcus sp. 7F3_DIV0205]